MNERLGSNGSRRFYRVDRPAGFDALVLVDESAASMDHFRHVLLTHDIGYHFESRIADWIAPTVRFVDRDASGFLRESDAPYFIMPCLSLDLAETFRDLIEPGCELLELMLADGGRVFSINKLRHPEALDLSRTEFLVVDGTNQAIIQPAFAADIETECHMFGIGHWLTLDWLIVSDVFVDRWTSLGLRGLSFTPLS